MEKQAVNTLKHRIPRISPRFGLTNNFLFPFAIWLDLITGWPIAATYIVFVIGVSSIFFLWFNYHFYRGNVEFLFSNWPNFNLLIFQANLPLKSRFYYEQFHILGIDIIFNIRNSQMLLESTLSCGSLLETKYIQSPPFNQFHKFLSLYWNSST